LVGLISPAFAQVKTETPPIEAGAKPVTVERKTIRGASLEGNLEGNSADRDLIVFLPPGYASAKSRRYPVVYALHGYSIGASQWSQEIQVPQTIEGAFAKGASEMIVVLPDSKTVHNGSMYSSSVTTGDFERSCTTCGRVCGALPHHTEPDEPRTGGHSMGGYGRRASYEVSDVFGNKHLSPCCYRRAQRTSQPRKRRSKRLNRPRIRPGYRLVCCVSAAA
jgi:hypothetical protein